MPGLPYFTPASALRQEIAGWDGLWEGTIVKNDCAYPITVIKEEGDEVLAAGPTFFGWIRREFVIRDADDE